MTAVALSIQLLIAIQEGNNVSATVYELSSLSIEQLSNDLHDMDERKAFWINCYNAFTQILIKEKSPDLLSQTARTLFFSAKEIIIARHSLSLNEIEHGMLRHSSVWWSKGHLRKIAPTDFERKFRVPLDYRIHFALNCGARSCPPIRFYDPNQLDDQLDVAMNSFLVSDVEFDKRTNTVTVSKIFDWFRGDFGGKRGIINLLWSQHLIPDDRKVKINFREYDWTVLLHKFDA